jgi:hypothetical protein
MVKLMADQDLLAGRKIQWNNESVLSTRFRGCLKSPANAKFTERGTGFMPAFRKLK